jgi:hypothetical protein
MALTKESFLALTPALVMLRSALIASRTGLPWVQANRRHPWASLLLLGWSAGIVALMARTSGVAGPGFTGVVWDPLRILETALQFAAYNAQGLVLALLAVLYVVVNRGVANPGGAVFAVAVFGCALGPQAVIHSASGLPLSAERYVIPASLVHALPVALLLQWLVDTFRERDLSSLRPVLHWVEGSLIVGLLAGLVAGFCAVSGMGSAAILDGIAAFTNRAISSHWPALLHRLGYAVSAGCLAGLGVAAAYRRTPQPLRVARMAVTAMVAYLAAATWESSRAFAKEGWDAMCVINTVAAVETSPSVLMVVDPAADAPEKVYSVTEYLRIKKRIGNIVYHLIDTAPATGYRAAWRAELLQCYGERLVGVPGALVSTTCVVVLSQQDEFVRRAGSDALRAFSKTTCGPMTVYCRAESGELTP